MVREDPRKLIIEALIKNPEGLTILSLASATGLHRHTCTKYIHELIGADIIYQRSVGVAKLCYLKKNIETKTDEKKVLEKLRKKRTSKSQIKLLASIVILTFLFSETAIIAYGNVSYLNETNFSNINTSPMTATTPNISDLVDFFNISEPANESSNVTVDEPTVTNELNNSRTVDGMNGTNSTELVNQTENVTILENATNTSQTQNNTNISRNETTNFIINETIEQNETVETLNETNETSIDPIVLKPVFEVSLEYSERVTRGQAIIIKADIKNTGYFAKNVEFLWILPDSFEIVSGDNRVFCGDLDFDDSCSSEIGVMMDLSTNLGLNEIKVVVSYEE